MKADIGTPHSHHRDNAILCLNHNKSVLVEKAFTVNAKEAKVWKRKLWSFCFCLFVFFVCFNWYIFMNCITLRFRLSFANKNYKINRINQLIGCSFLRSPHSDVWELLKQDAHFLTHTIFYPRKEVVRARFGNSLTPKADYAGKNVLLSTTHII